MRWLLAISQHSISAVELSADRTADVGAPPAGMRHKLRWLLRRTPEAFAVTLSVTEQGRWRVGVEFAEMPEALKTPKWARWGRTVALGSGGSPRAALRSAETLLPHLRASLNQLDRVSRPDRQGRAPEVEGTLGR